MKKRKSLYILIVGCGRLGSRSAGILSNQGHSVVVLDTDEKHFESLPPEFTGFRILGDCTEIEILKEAKISRADMVLAFTDDDNTNYMVSQVAKEVFKVKNVIARVYDPANLKLFHQFNIKTITPMLLALESLIGTFEAIMEEEE